MMPMYLPPEENSLCACRQEGRFVPLCYYGHLTECHFPYPCRMAGCTHLAKSDYTVREVREMQDAARVQLIRGFLTGYAFNQNGLVVAVPRDVN